MLTKLEAMAPATLRKRYERYLHQVAAVLREIKAPEETLRLALRSEKVLEFRERIIQRLNSPDLVARLADPFSRGRMPELWDDRLARDNFEESFFEYLLSIAQRTGRRPRTPAEVLRRAEALDADHWTDIRDALERYLRQTGWFEDDWE